MKEQTIKPLRSAIIFLTLYGLWCFGLRVIIKTFITYFSRSAQSPLHDIADAFSSSGLFVAAFASFGFLWFAQQLHLAPNFWNPRKIFSEQRFKILLPGFFQGMMLGICLIAGLIANRDYLFLSAFVVFADPINGILSLLLRAFALVLLIACEDTLFRTFITQKLEYWSRLWVRFVFLGFCYAIIKGVQFDIGWMQGLTVLLLGAVIFSFSILEHPRQIGFLMGLLGVIHIIFGSPIFGSNFNGLFLIRVVESESRFKVFFNGGLGGPLSSFALQVILLVLFLSRVLKTSKENQKTAVLNH